MVTEAPTEQQKQKAQAWAFPKYDHELFLNMIMSFS